MSCATIYRTGPLVLSAGASSFSLKRMEWLRDWRKCCHTKDSAPALSFQENLKKNVDGSIGRRAPGPLIVSFVLLMHVFIPYISSSLTVPWIPSRLEKYIIYSFVSYTQYIIYTSIFRTYTICILLHSFIYTKNACGLKCTLRQQGGLFTLLHSGRLHRNLLLPCVN